jgi:hypothetical protein
MYRLTKGLPLAVNPLRLAVKLGVTWAMLYAAILHKLLRFDWPVALTRCI